MKTAKELLELKKEKQEKIIRINKDIEEEWDSIVKTISEFKVSETNTHITVPKIKYKVNAYKIYECGFFIFDVLCENEIVSKIFFDKNECLQNFNRRAHSFKTGNQPYNFDIV